MGKPFAHGAAAVLAAGHGFIVSGFGGFHRAVGDADGEAALLALLCGVAAVGDVGGIQAHLAALQDKVAAGIQTACVDIERFAGDKGGVALEAVDLAEREALACARLLQALAGFAVAGRGHAV